MASGLIGHPKLAEAEAMRARGESYRNIAATLGLPRGQVERYFMAREKAQGKKPAKEWKAPPYPEVEGKSTKEQATLHAAWLKDAIDSALMQGLTPKEVAPLSSQYAAALRLVARLDGSLEITSAQILRSAEFQRCLAALRRAVGDDLAVWHRWEKEVAALMGET